MHSNPIVVKIKLRTKVNVIPDGGLTASRLRVELVEKEKTNSAWIAELKVLGDLPWNEGEERQVELRIMSDEFRNHVTNVQPSLLVKYGSDILGDLKY